MADRRIRVKRGSGALAIRVPVGGLVMIEDFDEPLTVLQRVAYVSRYVSNENKVEGFIEYVECERLTDGVRVDCTLDQIAPVSKEVLLMLHARMALIRKAISQGMKAFTPETGGARLPVAAQDVAIPFQEVADSDPFAAYLRNALQSASSLRANPVPALAPEEDDPMPVPINPATPRIRRRHAGPDLMADDDDGEGEIEEIEEVSPYTRRRGRNG